MRKTIHFYRKYTSCHIDLIASHFYFILFLPKSQHFCQVQTDKNGKICNFVKLRPTKFGEFRKNRKVSGKYEGFGEIDDFFLRNRLNSFKLCILCSTRKILPFEMLNNTQKYVYKSIIDVFFE